jgi:hypothetical protein
MTVTKRKKLTLDGVLRDHSLPRDRRLRPTDIPEAAIERLAASMKIDTAAALDIIMDLYDEAVAASGGRR